MRRTVFFAAFACYLLGSSDVPAAGAATGEAPQCAPTARDCAALALAAMGGRKRIEAVKALELEGVQHTLLVEQSYRQEPFITAYARTQEKIDFGAQRMLIQTHLTWPEPDPGQSESDTTLVVGPEGGVYRAEKSDSPASRADIEAARHALALGPMRLLLGAIGSADLHFENAQRMRFTLHPVLAFNWQGRPVRVMINPVAQQGEQSKGWERPFKAEKGVTLAPGITLFPGSWNATVVKQDDGIVLLEAPLSGTYMTGVIDKAKEQNPGQPLKAVLSTSDSWPHVGGVRQVVALGLPVYILDLNKPLLERLVASPRHLHPDLLAQSARSPMWRIVSQKVQVGTGPNRVELYPLRGAATERQYMVYFPAHQLLYASDTLALNADGSLYAPELLREVIDAVKRENLAVTTVFAMHREPVPWAQVTP
jgi:hypothetical protein